MLLIQILNTGLLYGVLAIGVMLTYKVLDFADLSVDGSVPLGGVVTAIMITRFSQPWLGLLASFVAGVVAGTLTGLLHVKLKISGLLSGILVMTGLYSINLMIAGNNSNIPLSKWPRIFNVENLLSSTMNYELKMILVSLIQLGLLIVIVLVVKLAIDWFLRTRFGFLVKIAGDNPQLVTSLGQNLGKVQIITLALSNGLVALFGGLFVQFQGVYNLSVGSGMVVVGLASVIMGTSLLGRVKRLRMTTMVIVGAVLYRLIIAVALMVGIPSYYEKLLTVIIFVLTIALSGQNLRKVKKHVEAY